MDSPLPSDPIDSEIDTRALESGISFSLQRIRENIDAFGPNEYPEPGSSNGLIFDLIEGPSRWTPAFWTGQCWLADVIENDEQYREKAIGHLAPFRQRLEDKDAVLTHDLGFLYTLAAWANYDRTGNETARQTALRAADLLAERFHSEPGIIQAWNDHRPGSETAETKHYGQTIVDTMMNIPLLYRASACTGYDYYQDIATTHAATTAEYAVREDGSTAHTIGFDVEDGSFEGAWTHQGYADDSCWSRGQAWTIYGFALAYRHTGREDFRKTAELVSNYYLDELPNDLVPPWDFRAEEGIDDRDSSAAAIAACGFLELASHLPVSNPDRQYYENAALATLTSLATDYTTEGAKSNGILAEGAYNWKNGNYGQCTAWGDYFFFEGLLRATREWTPWWARDAPVAL